MDDVIASVGDSAETHEACRQTRSPLFYLFVHHALRNAVLDHPVTCREVLESADRYPFLASLTHGLDANGGSGDFEVRALEIVSTELAGCPCVVVKMPSPVASGEAFFAGFVIMVGTEDLLAGEVDDTKATCRYFTLEKHVVSHGRFTTVLGEWTRNAEQVMHLHHGPGPSPRVQDFLSAMEQRIIRDTLDSGLTQKPTPSSEMTAAVS